MKNIPDFNITNLIGRAIWAGQNLKGLSAVAYHYYCLKNCRVDLENPAVLEDVMECVDAGYYTLDKVIENNKKNIPKHGLPLIRALNSLGYFEQAVKIAEEYKLPVESTAQEIT